MIGIAHRILEEWMKKSNSNTRPILGGVCWKGEMEVEFGHGESRVQTSIHPSFNIAQFWKTIIPKLSHSLILFYHSMSLTGWNENSLLGCGRSLKSIAKQRKEAGKKVSVESPVWFDASKKWLQAGNTANNSKWFNDTQWNVSNLFHQSSSTKRTKNCDGCISWISLFLLCIPLDWQN